MPYYAVAKGRSTGVYQNWSDCENQVKGYSGATFKKFESASSAQEFVASQGGSSSYSSNSNDSYGSGSYYSNFGGSGGYFGSNNRFERDSAGFVQVYTDGACSSNGREGARRAGIGIYWGDGHHLNTAMKQAVEHGVRDLTISTDSKFVIKAATTSMPGWKEDGWRLKSGKPVTNEQDFKELDRAQIKLNVKWNYVEGLGGIEGNEKADQLAKAGASKYK